MLHIIYGNSGSGKTSYLQSEILRMAKCHPELNYFLVVPEQFSLETTKDLASKAEGGVILNIDALGFTRLAWRVFGELGLAPVVLGETGKSLILRRLAIEKEDELFAIKEGIRKTGYISEIKSMISELMQHGISVEEFAGYAEHFPEDSDIALKIKDIGTMYESFLKYIEDNFITPEQVLDILSEVASRSEILKKSVFAFDGFTGFTPVQRKFIKKLMHIGVDIYVSVTFDSRLDFDSRGERTGAGEADLFGMSRTMLGQLLRDAEEEKCGISPSVCMEPKANGRFAKNPALFHLEQQLFRPGAEKYEEDACGRLRVVECKSPAAELRYAAENIVRLARKYGLRYRDFAVVASDAARYSDYAKEVFGKYEIPYFADVNTDITGNPFIEWVRAVLEMLGEDFTRESVFRYLRCGFSDIRTEEIDELETYAIACGIKKGKSKWTKPFVRVPRYAKKYKNDYSKTASADEKTCEEEYLEKINVLRERFIEPLLGTIEAFAGRGVSVRTRTEALFDLIRRFEIEGKLKTRQEYLESAGEGVQALIYSQIYRVVIDLLDKLVELLGDEKLSRREYAEVLEEGFSKAKVSTIPPGSDCVILGDIERTRLSDIKVLFLLGANDSLIPKASGRGGILSAYDRERLSEFGAELAPTPRDEAFNQKFYLYMYLTKPSEALIVTYAAGDKDGKAMRRSYIVSTLLNLFPGIETEYPNETDFSGDTKKSISDKYISELSKTRDGETTELFKTLYAYLSEQDETRGDAKRLFDAAFTRYETKKLGRELARMLYGAVLHNSVSRIEKYMECAFRHFLQYGLGLSEREEFSFEKIDLGNVLHKIMEKLGRGMEPEEWLTISEEEFDRRAQAVADEVTKDLEDTAISDSAKDRYTLDRIQRIIRRSADTVIRQIKSGKFIPEKFELRFEAGLGENKFMNLTGIIDRIDIFRDAQNLYYKIVDYKSGGTSFDIARLCEGRQLQLAVYTKVVGDELKKENPGKNVVPAAMLYVSLDDPIIAETENPEDTDALTAATLEKMRPSGIVNSDENVWRNMDESLPGIKKSVVIPVTLKKGDVPSEKSKNIIDTAGFRTVSEYAVRKAEEAGSAILGGDIDIFPYYAGDSDNACKNCSYKSICRFDGRIEGFRRKEEKLDAGEAWEKILSEEKA